MEGEKALGDRRLAPDKLLLARGTYRDTWLCELMKRELERGPAEVVLALKERSLRYPPQDSPRTGGRRRRSRSSSSRSCRRVALEDITGICIKRPR